MTVAHEHPIDARAVAQARDAAPTADETARLAGLLSVMADPLRLRIVFALDETVELCVGDLALALDVSEDAAGYALRLLRAAGLVTTRKHGRVVYNRLSPDFPEPLLHYCLRELIKITSLADR
jgi:ArsR family transcriptional regulator, lead/cadmium/zinc/bismuth-responsive transcriptional repressor